MWHKFAKYWNDIHLILAVAVVLDPQYKLAIVEYYADKFGSSNTDLVADRVKAVLSDLVREYQSKLDKQPFSSYLNSVGNSSATDLDFDLYVSQRKRSRTTLVTTELDHYLADDLHPRSSKFDILNWWSVNGAKYPTLQQIARDFLAVPITSVASEFAFSAGGRLLDPHRSRLHHSTVEAMMCARSWIRDEMKQFQKKEKMELEGVFSALVMKDTTVEEQTGMPLTFVYYLFEVSKIAHLY
ncbi:Zinc finger BED domain-containing protein RICESLEEPER 1 [Linum grandiflorum]